MPPPKKPDNKKAQAAVSDDDMADVNSLPLIKTMTVSILYNFYVKGNYDSVKLAIDDQLIEEHLPDGLKHVKTITRKDILEIAQAKIDEQNAAAEGEAVHKQLNSQFIAQ